MSDNTMLTTAEMFAGSGAVHLAMQAAGFRTLYANDFCPHKRKSYAANFPDVRLDGRSIQEVRGHELPFTRVRTVSAPCKDHSINGERQGWDGEHGSMAFEEVRIVGELRQLGRAPHVVCFENVTGLLTLNKGRDFAALCQAMASVGYVVGAVVINAIRFLPQNRDRVFLVAFRADLAVPSYLVGAAPDDVWHPGALRTAHSALPPEVRKAWRWWRMSVPPTRTSVLSDLLEAETVVTTRMRESRQDELAARMLPGDIARIAKARSVGVTAGVTFGKLRGKGDGQLRYQEVKFDGYARCLLAGEGHEAQRLIILDDSPRGFCIRDFTPRERARLTGLPDDYVLPAAVTRVTELTGDAVVVPVYCWLAQHLLRPLAEAEPAIVTTRAPQPRRARKQTDADGRIESGRRGIKGRTTAMTTYLLPSAAKRLKALAADAGIPASELLLRGIDRLLTEAGQPPLERYVPAPSARRNASASKRTRRNRKTRPATARRVRRPRSGRRCASAQGSRCSQPSVAGAAARTVVTYDRSEATVALAARHGLYAEALPMRDGWGRMREELLIGEDGRDNG